MKRYVFTHDPQPIKGQTVFVRCWEYATMTPVATYSVDIHNNQFTRTEGASIVLNREEISDLINCARTAYRAQ